MAEFRQRHNVRNSRPTGEWDVLKAAVAALLHRTRFLVIVRVGIVHPSIRLFPPCLLVLPSVHSCHSDPCATTQHTLRWRRWLHVFILLHGDKTDTCLPPSLPPSYQQITPVSNSSGGVAATPPSPTLPDRINASCLIHPFTVQGY